MPQLLRLSMALGAVPLFAGTFIYWAWRFTRWSFLERAGMMTVLLGIVAVIAGTVLLVRHLWRESRGPRTTQGSLWHQGAIAGTLLFLNLPVAAFYIMSAAEISTRYTVNVQNESDTAIESVVLTGPGIQVEVGPIPPGARIPQHLHFGGDGPLRFDARQEGIEFGEVLEGYVTGSMRGSKTIRVTGKGVFELTDDELARRER